MLINHQGKPLLTATFGDVLSQALTAFQARCPFRDVVQSASSWLKILRSLSGSYSWKPPKYSTRAQPQSWKELEVTA